MKDFQRKRKVRKFLYSRGALVIVIALLLLMTKAVWGVYAKERESARNLSRVESDLAALQAREQKLKEDISRLNTPEGVEAAIREQFQVAKPGERMVVLVGEKSGTPEETVKKQSLISKFFNLFR